MKNFMIVFYLFNFNLFLFINFSVASEYTITDQCYKLMLQKKVDKSAINIVLDKEFYKPIFKREGTEGVRLKVVDFGIPQFEGLYASYNGKEILHCWSSFSRVTAVLIEKNKFFYEPIHNRKNIYALKCICICMFIVGQIQ